MLLVKKQVILAFLEGKCQESPRINVFRDKMSKKQVGFYTAVSLVIANIIGTGVFTSLGFQVGEIDSVFSIMFLWVLGGVIALCGALTYAELASAMPHSGGEYYYLSRLYHPALGFLGGWISLFVGFSAPVALASIAFAKYFSSVVPALDSNHIAAGIVVLITLVHSYKVKTGSAFQVVFTAVKLVLIVVFVIAGFSIDNPQDITLIPESRDWSLIFSSAFAVSLIYVSYSYSGWNAAVYIASEIKNPRRNLPLALISGTVVVLILYALINFVFLYASPMQDLAGKLEIGHVTATAIFGKTGGDIMSMVISLLLVSMISAMVFVGPRVIQAMAKDIFYLKFFSEVTKRGAPARAIFFQFVITIVFIYTSTFEAVMKYAGFVLNLSTLITVIGLFVHRYKNRNDRVEGVYRTVGYPFVPIIFVLLNLWILVSLMMNETTESLYGLITVLIGLIFYFISNKILDKKLI